MAVFHNHTCVAAGEGRRKMAVSLDFYKTFYYAAKYGSFTEAAKALYVTQPTVTHAISCLERELGCALFVRSRKGAALTPEGSLLYEHVRAAFDHLQEAEKTLQDRKALLSGQVRIGASETTLHFFLLPCLRNYRRLYPGVRLKVSNGTTPQALAALREGAIDCAILVMRRDYRSILQPQDLMRVVALADFQDIFIAGNDFSVLKDRAVTPEELTAYPFIAMEPGTLTRQCMDDFFLRFYLNVVPDIELATTDLIVPVAAHNLGIGFVPEPFAARALSEGSVFSIRLTEPVPPRQICLVYRTDLPLSIAAQAFLRLLSIQETEPVNEAESTARPSSRPPE